MRSSLSPWIATAAILAAAAAILLLMGRSPICPCGTIRLWDGDPWGGENSQHISDWYSLSHIIHGFLFYGALWLVAPRLSFGWRLTIATLVEAGWEILENSPMVIERYRNATVSLSYNGDSVLNSIMDILFMVFGFALAARLPVWLTVVLAIGMEILAAVVIRDNLTLNVLMLLWPVQSVIDWQLGSQPQTF